MFRRQRQDAESRIFRPHRRAKSKWHFTGGTLPELDCISRRRAYSRSPFFPLCQSDVITRDATLLLANILSQILFFRYASSCKYRAVICHRNRTQKPMRGLADYREAATASCSFYSLLYWRTLSLIANLVNERRHWMRLSNWRSASDVETHHLASASTLSRGGVT